MKRVTSGRAFTAKLMEKYPARGYTVGTVRPRWARTTTTHWWLTAQDTKQRILNQYKGKEKLMKIIAIVYCWWMQTRRAT